MFSSKINLWNSFTNPLIVAPSLFIRKASIDDCSLLFKYNVGNVRASFFDFKSEDELREWLRNSLINCEEGKKLELVIFRNDNDFIGSVGVNNLQAIPEFGIWIKEKEQGRGLGRKVIIGIAQWMLSSSEYPYLLYKSEKTNLQSIRFANSMNLKLIEPTLVHLENDYLPFAIDREIVGNFKL
jgi:RimJ/RimL family protein N-acetyltransferase